MLKAQEIDIHTMIKGELEPIIISRSEVDRFSANGDPLISHRNKTNRVSPSSDHANIGLNGSVIAAHEASVNELADLRPSRLDKVAEVKGASCQQAILPLVVHTE